MKTVFFIHGFSAKKEDNEYFLKYLEKKKDIKVKTFILPGHSEHGVKKITYDKWLEKSEEELLKVLKTSKSVVIVGHSMGGAIATVLAAKYDIEKLVLISPAFKVGSTIQNKEDIKNYFKDKNKEYGTGFEGIIKKIFTVYLKDIKEVKKVAKISSKYLEEITCPVLILHGSLDQVVPLSSSIDAYSHITSKKDFTILMDVRHQVFKSCKKEQISKYIYTYIVGGLRFKINKKEHI
jgi:esterase/lipase